MTQRYRALRLNGFRVWLLVVSLCTTPSITQAATTTHPIQSRQAARVGCHNSSGGLINFRGSLHGNAVYGVRILADTEVSEFYIAKLRYQSSGRTNPPEELQAQTLEEANNLLFRAAASMRMVSAAPMAVVMDEKFECDGFPPGKYVFIGQDLTNPSSPVYFSTVDVTEIRRPVIVTIPTLQPL